MPELLTPRLRCTQLHADDWPFFLSLQQNPAVMHYVADPRSPEDIRAAFDSRLPRWQPGAEHWLCLVVRDRQSGQPLGLTGYVQQDDCAEAGFLFVPQAQGQGYGYESLRALCDYAFTDGGLRRLTATVTAGNLPSKYLLEKAGFVQEGELRESYWLRGRWHNDWLFGLLRHDQRPV